MKKTSPLAPAASAALCLIALSCSTGPTSAPVKTTVAPRPLGVVTTETSKDPTSPVSKATSAKSTGTESNSGRSATAASTATAPAPASAPVETNAVTAAPAPARVNTNDPIARIRDEGLNHSQVMETLSYLTDVIGPRLTGSPGMRRANGWTREKLTGWGLTNAAEEPWGVFGRGWNLRRFAAQVIEPQTIPLKAYPSAWSPGFDYPLVADVVYLNATNTAQLEPYKGKLKGAIVLASQPRAVAARFEPLARRMEATNLLQLANAEVPVETPTRTNAPSGRRSAATATGDQPNASTTTPPNSATATATDAASASTNAPARPRAQRGGGGFAGWTRFLPFLTSEGAALILNPSTIGDGGTIFVSSASVPQPERDRSSTGANTNNTSNAAGGTNAAPRIAAYATNAPAYPAQLTVAVEDYNRLVRMAQFGEKIKMQVDLQADFLTNDFMAYNTVAEIPGSDLKNEIVMVGAHMDSWQSGTGATDNGAGVAAAMEAVRIIKALNLQPRRTIRIALWSGEEEGLLGSRAYVTKHFGYFKTNATEKASASSSSRARGGERELVKEKDYEKFSAYFNLDNGAGKIRGVYMQGNEAVRPYFRKWLEPFRDLGAETLSPSNTGSTDHVSFSNIGLPGFQFIQDPLEYGTRTHHSNEDVFDRVAPEDMKQAATIMAAFVYNAAMLDERLPRKAVDETPRTFLSGQ